MSNEVGSRLKEIRQRLKMTRQQLNNLTLPGTKSLRQAQIEEH